MIETALAAPFAGVYDREFYPELAQKAAVLLFTLAKSQACRDGNKRLALILVETFLRLNGYELHESANDPLEEMIRRAEATLPADRAVTLDQLSKEIEAALLPFEEEL